MTRPRPPFPQSYEPVLTKDDWLAACRKHRSDAGVLLAHGSTTNVWFLTGLAVEACVKAVIMQKEGWNSWPSKDAAPDLYTHDLLELFQRIGVDPGGFDTLSPIAPALKTVLEWRREHGYAKGTVPKRVAEGLHDAAFGGNGVVEWLAKNYRLGI